MRWVHRLQPSADRPDVTLPQKPGFPLRMKPQGIQTRKSHPSGSISGSASKVEYEVPGQTVPKTTYSAATIQQRGRRVRFSVPCCSSESTSQQSSHSLTRMLTASPLLHAGSSSFQAWLFSNELGRRLLTVHLLAALAFPLLQHDWQNQTPLKAAEGQRQRSGPNRLFVTNRDLFPAF